MADGKCVYPNCDSGDTNALDLCTPHDKQYSEFCLRHGVEMPRDEWLEEEIIDMTSNDDNTELARRETFIQPAASMEQMIDAFKSYQLLRDRIGEPSDFQQIPSREGPRSFPKKSFVRKVQRYFGLSCEIIRDEPLRDSDGTITAWLATVKASHTGTGSSQQGDGTCSMLEKNENQRTEHNIRAHAVTRAKNRAVMDLVGFGETTADELGSIDPAPARQSQQTRQPKRYSAPLGPPAANGEGNGEGKMCEIHNKKFFKSGKMPKEAHPIVNEAGDTIGWCDRPED
jgi:hypothetical protein